MTLTNEMSRHPSAVLFSNSVSKRGAVSPTFYTSYVQAQLILKAPLERWTELHLLPRVLGGAQSCCAFLLPWVKAGLTFSLVFTSSPTCPKSSSMCFSSSLTHLFIHSQALPCSYKDRETTLSLLMFLAFRKKTTLPVYGWSLAPAWPAGFFGSGTFSQNSKLLYHFG